jgi:hypothetical protein
MVALIAGQVCYVAALHHLRLSGRSRGHSHCGAHVGHAAGTCPNPGLTVMLVHLTRTPRHGRRYMETVYDEGHPEERVATRTPAATMPVSSTSAVLRSSTSPHTDWGREV